MQDAIHRSYLAGQLEWPDLRDVAPDDYAMHLQSLQVSCSNLERHGAELYLALACGQGDPKAVRTLERCFFPDLDEYLTRSGFEAATRQDVFQQLLLQLCTGQTPRILSYAGRAALSSWLRVATYRLALVIGERSHFPRKRDSDITLNHLFSSDVDPETQATIEKARPLFQAALHSVMADLKDRDRTLLRLCFLDGLTIDGIGTLYGVHRATAARWICDIRQRILREVEGVLVRDFGLRASEFKSLAFLVHSELHLSLIRVLGAA
jgi:RNA polymerase sigma-70 factor (ECF subfamily)